MRREAGFSLLELVVSLVVIAVVLALAAQLLGETQLAFVTIARENRVPSQHLAAEWLRRDLRASRALGEDASWAPSSDALWLLRGEGWVSYEVRDRYLVRTAFDLSNRRGASRPILGEVVGWSWRRPSAGLVEVTVVTEEPLARLLRVRADLDRPASEARTLRLLIAQRGVRLGW